MYKTSTYLLLTIVALLPFSIFCQSNEELAENAETACLEESSLSRMGLNGPVKSAFVVEFAPSSPSIDWTALIGEWHEKTAFPDEMISGELTMYDSTGNKSSVHFFVKESNSITGLNFTYNRNGKILRIEATDLVLTDSYLYEASRIYYYTSGCILNGSTYKSRNETTTGIYDIAGRLIESVLKFDDSEYESRTTIAYDSLGNITNEVKLDFDGNPGVQTNYTYDENSNLITVYEVSPNNLPVQQKAYFYDEEGRIVEERNFEAGEPIKVTKYIYYESGKDVIELVGVGQFLDKTTSRYDLNDRILSKDVYVSHTQTTELWSYDYKFDAYGNWIERIEILNGEPMHIYQVFYEYYGQ